MATLFNRNFDYYEFSKGDFDVSGFYVNGEISKRTVRGTVQTMTAQECESYQDGSRNSGYVKIYSSEKLQARKEGGFVGGFVLLAGNVYQILDEMPNLNDLIPHFKYVACFMDKDIWPKELKAIL